MSAKKLVTRSELRGTAVGRRRIAQKYLEVAELVATEDGPAIHVSVGLAVLAGIAAGDAICIVARGERYAGQDHAAAAELLSLVERRLGDKLRDLNSLKPASHYGTDLLTAAKRDKALRAASVLVEEAVART